LSDGGFAVAITLLVLDLIKVPQAPEGQTFSAAALAAILGRQWPAYATFLISFATILIFQWVQKSDPVLMFANGFLLLLVTLVPFPTALLGDYLREPAAPTAAAMYAGLFVIISIAFILLWWTAAYRRPLLRPGIPPASTRAPPPTCWGSRSTCSR
jgi:TMEM175 potassium channel family protein